MAVPLQVDDQAGRLAVISRWAWIKPHRARFESQERQSAAEFVTGESHSYQGQRYLLNVVYHDAPGRVVLRNGTTMDLYVRTGSDAGRRERVLLAWYRARLKEAIPSLLAKWEAIIGVEVAEWGVKRMKTRWGSCNVEARRIWLNLELIKRPAHSLEYIIVHEMAHLLERGHGARFVALMDQFVPEWRLFHAELNSAPVTHATGEY